MGRAVPPRARLPGAAPRRSPQAEPTAEPRAYTPLKGRAMYALIIRLSIPWSSASTSQPGMKPCRAAAGKQEHRCDSCWWSTTARGCLRLCTWCQRAHQPARQEWSPAGGRCVARTAGCIDERHTGNRRGFIPARIWAAPASAAPAALVAGAPSSSRPKFGMQKALLALLLTHAKAPDTVLVLVIERFACNTLFCQEREQAEHCGDALVMPMLVKPRPVHRQRHEQQQQGQRGARCQAAAPAARQRRDGGGRGPPHPSPRGTPAAAAQ